MLILMLIPLYCTQLKSIPVDINPSIIRNPTPITISKKQLMRYTSKTNKTCTLLIEVSYVEHQNNNSNGNLYAQIQFVLQCSFRVLLIFDWFVFVVFVFVFVFSASASIKEAKKDKSRGSFARFQSARWLWLTWRWIWAQIECKRWNSGARTQSGPVDMGLGHTNISGGQVSHRQSYTEIFLALEHRSWYDIDHHRFTINLQWGCCCTDHRLVWHSNGFDNIVEHVIGHLEWHEFGRCWNCNVDNKKTAKHTAQYTAQYTADNAIKSITIRWLTQHKLSSHLSVYL